jgi:hypothetical protein
MLALTACGTLPQPFYGDPGKVGAQLAVPPAPVLIIPTPGNAMLDDQSAAAYAQDLAAALAAADVPSIAGPATKHDWRLTTTASISGQTVSPAYAITGADNKFYGSVTGAPVPAAAWANPTPAVLTAAANADSLIIAKKLAAVNAAIQGSNPESLENRPPRVFIGAVTGAPGDGDNALSLGITRDLPGPDIELVTDPKRADFTVTAIIKTQPDAKNQILVELDWIIHDANNRQIGQVTQLHDLAATDIIPYWGDVAAAAATEAATGIHEVITNAVLHKTPQTS